MYLPKINPDKLYVCLDSCVLLQTTFLIDWMCPMAIMKTRCSHLGLLSSQPGFPGDCCAFTAISPWILLCKHKWKMHGSRQITCYQVRCDLCHTTRKGIPKTSLEGKLMKKKAHSTLKSCFKNVRGFANHLDLHSSPTTKLWLLEESHSHFLFQSTLRIPLLGKDEIKFWIQKGETKNV